MKVSPINTIYQSITHFKSKNKPEILGYSDNISELKRNYIRSHFEEKYMPNSDIFNKEGRLEEFGLNKLIKSVTDQKIPSVNDKKMRELHLLNLGSIGNNSYRGAMLNIYNIDEMPKLKEAGIKQIVDLTFNDMVENACIKNGIDYYTPVEITFFEPAFKSEDEVREEYIKLNRDIIGVSEEKLNDAVENNVKQWKQNTRQFIDGFVEFIQTMQKGNSYIGCYMGTDTTDGYVFFNGLFNPKFKDFKPSHVINTNMGIAVNDARNLYEHLTPEDKRKMGWDEKFEEKFLNRLDMFDEYYNY